MSTTQSFGPYRLLERLGRGGMGEVFRAEHMDSGRIVAIKTLRISEHGTDGLDALEIAQLRKRFLREGSLLSTLEPHRHVVRVLEVLEPPEVPKFAIVMEHLAGSSLDRFLDVTSIEPQKALGYAQELASALQHIHRHDLIHRDVKPANIVLAERGKRLVLVDFGLVKDLNPLSESTRHTMTDQVLGTPEYMSPEQLLGETLSPSTDIFSFGATLYHMLTGHSPFRGENRLETSDNLRFKHPSPAHSLNSSIPVELSELVDRCLRKDLEGRPGSMDEIVQSLNEPSQQARWALWLAAAFLIGVSIWIGLEIVEPDDPAHDVEIPADPIPPPPPTGQMLAVLPFDGEPDQAAVFSLALAADLEQAGLRIVDPETVLDAFRDLEIETSGFEASRDGSRLTQYLGIDGWIAGTVKAHDGTGGLWRVTPSARLADGELAYRLDPSIGTSAAKLAEQVADQLYGQTSIQPSRASRVRARAELPNEAQARALYARGILAPTPMAARRLFELALAEEPDSAPIQTQLIDALRDLGFGRRAAAAVEEALESPALGDWKQEILLQGDLLSSKTRRAALAKRQIYESIGTDFEAGWAWLEISEAVSTEDALAVLDQLEKDGSLKGLPATRSRVRLLLESSQFEQALGLADDFLAHAQQLAASRSKGLALLYRAIALQGLNRASEASAALEKAQAELSAVDDPLLEAQTLEWAGLLMRNQGQASAALQLFQSARIKYAELAGIYGESVEALDAQASMHEGMALNDLGQVDEAKALMMASLERLERIGAQREAATTANNLGVVYHLSGDLDRAADLYKRCLELAEQIDHHQLRGSALVNLGELEANLGRHRSALDFYPQALGHFEESERGGEPAHQIYTLLLQGDSFLNLGELDSAKSSFAKAIDLSKELDDPAAHTARAQEGLARVERLRHGEAVP